MLGCCCLFLQHMLGCGEIGLGIGGGAGLAAGLGRGKDSGNDDPVGAPPGLPLLVEPQPCTALK